MPSRCGASLFSGLLLFLIAAAPLCGQDAVPQSPPAASSSSGSSSSKSSNRKHSHATDFLIRGTVFNEKAFAFPGAELRIRRAGEKKFRWQDYSNSRGEFAIRVPQGAQYEMVVRAKGFAEQAKSIDAKSGISDTNLVFHMEPLKGGKK